MNIAIDGYAGSGKTVLAKESAKALNIKVFDTGAMYRAIACEWDAKNLGKITKSKVEKFLKNLTISVKFVNGNQRTFVNGTDYTPLLRLEKISMLSVLISPFPSLREFVRKVQRDFAKNNDCVMEGRDIGSEVLPNADVKLFITAPVEVRAMRRYTQLKANQPDIEYNKVLEDIKERDFLDESREVGALKIVPDAIVINNCNKSIAESLNECLKHIKEVQKLKKNYK